MYCLNVLVTHMKFVAMLNVSFSRYQPATKVTIELFTEHDFTVCDSEEQQFYQYKFI